MIIEFFEFINSNLIADSKKEKKLDDIKNLYNTEPKKLLDNAKKIVKKFPENDGEIKKKKNWIMVKLNKIEVYLKKFKNFFKRNKKK